jgi:hypothetical protein
LPLFVDEAHEGDGCVAQDPRGAGKVIELRLGSRIEDLIAPESG